MLLIPMSVSHASVYLVDRPRANAVQGNLDYANLPSKTPAWKGSHNLGHSAAFDVPNAGIPGIAGRKILQWVLRGDRSAKKWFVGGQAHQDGFVNVTSQHLDSIRVTPI
jgi:hypothetical protein